ncbi:unnamed protein product [Linum trigynum]|uniref:Uncharacterized protein n=1 Tax=Linum trigynum TaxID=586398 RepID=A0AAV2DBY1_9ROSI
MSTPNPDSGTQSTTPSSTASTGQAGRGKNDPAWNYIQEIKEDNGKVQALKCMLCGIEKGGAGNSSDERASCSFFKREYCVKCSKVPYDVRLRFANILKEYDEKKEGKKKSNDLIIGDKEDDVVELVRSHATKNVSDLMKKAKGADFFAPRTTHGSQPSIKSAMATKDEIHRAHMICAEFFYENCIPFNAANSDSWQRMFDAAMAIGPGFKVPSYHDYGCLYYLIGREKPS